MGPHYDLVYSLQSVEPALPLLCLADWRKDIAILDILNIVPQWDASKAIVNINRIPLSEAILRNVVTF